MGVFEKYLSVWVATYLQVHYLLCSSRIIRDSSLNFKGNLYTFYLVNDTTNDDKHRFCQIIILEQVPKAFFSFDHISVIIKQVSMQF